MYKQFWHWGIISSFWILLITPGFSNTEESRGIDSCQTIRKQLDQAELIIDQDPVTAIKVAQKVINSDLSDCNESIRYQAKFLVCNIVTSTIPIQESIQCCQEALVHYQGKKEQKKLGKINNKLGIHYDIGGQKDSSILHFEAAEKIFLDLDDKHSLGELYNNWGVVYSVSWDTPKALELYQKALNYNIESDNITGHIASHTNIGRAHFKQKLYKEALTEYEKGLSLLKEYPAPFWEAIILAFIADVYYENKALQKARSTYLKASSIAEENENDYNLAYIFNKLARLELVNKNLEKALVYLDQAKEHSNKVGKKKDLAESYNLSAKVFIGLGRYEEAQEALQVAFEYANEENEKNHLAEYYSILAYYYLKQGDYENAFYAEQKHHYIKDGVLSYDNAALVTQLRDEHKSNLQKQQIFELEKAATQQRMYLLSVSALAIIVLSILATVLLYIQNRKKLIQRLENRLDHQTKELRRSNEELQRFAYITSHDLKTPLRNISSFAALVKKKISPYKDKELEELLAYVTDGAKQMNNLIEDVLTYSQISQGEKQVRSSVDLNDTISHVLENIGNLVQEHNAIVDYDNLPSIWSSPGQMIQLFQNLIINGIKYNHNPSPEIRIEWKERDEDYQFAVHDNGIGIEDDFKDNIFQMFKRLHSSQDYEGSGIGLALCKKIVEQHKGDIWLESTPEQGSSFYFTLAKTDQYERELQEQQLKEWL